MKPTYGDISLQTGALSKGLCNVMIVPKDWITNDVVADFNTGVVTTAITLAAGRNWLNLEFTPPSYDMEEKPKSGKSGPYIEVLVKGIINNIDAANLQVLETLRYQEFVTICNDKEKKIKIVGNKDHAMVLSISTKKTSNTEQSEISLMMDCEEYPPFYSI